MYIQVNIGRNYGKSAVGPWYGTPMPLELWDEFVTDVLNILDQYREHSDMGDEDPVVHRGTGVWDGVREDSAHISLFHEGGFDLDGIRGQLRRLKNEYGQDAIALIVGSELV